MWGCLLVLSLLASGSRASSFLSIVMIYDPDLNDTVAVRYKVASRNTCSLPHWTCQLEDCPSTSLFWYFPGEDCQFVGLSHYNLIQFPHLVLNLDDHQWINVTNNVTEVVAVTRVSMLRRSDTGRINVSPRANVLPVLRVPSNCKRNVTLPTFDPDGDVVTCRYQNVTSVLKLLPDCKMIFTPDSAIAEGAYAVQLIMEDFPRQNITLSNDVGKKLLLTREDAIGQIPIQFVLQVDSPVKSCVEEPAFSPPTPANGDHLYTSVNKTVEISIHLLRPVSGNLTLLLSGPVTMSQSIIDGHLVLVWTPSETDLNLSQAVCFALETVEAALTTRQSEMRCVIVTVHPGVVVAMRASVQSLFPLSVEDIRGFALTQLKEGLVTLGLPSDIMLRLVDYSEKSTATTPLDGE
ncbi:uncharacterized protein LOC127600097 isoform X2 [Hippocampus zosterae]|uniref:uncharacterized protein LOC127600097 isoform X2 n=1 Tax=Hippocampus zosterae TaxID=109293 RepID=UPI00223E2AAA|nr:uncharacterized protein LOC127600097 isoform X2 [Hippocampus zosterae]